MSATNSHTTYGPIEYDLLTLCLRLCLEPVDSHSPETQAVLGHYRPAWEAAAGGMSFDQALALLPSETAQPAVPCVVVPSIEDYNKALDNAVGSILSVYAANLIRQRAKEIARERVLTPSERGER